MHFEITHEFDIPLDALELAVISPSLVDKFGITVHKLGVGIEKVTERSRSLKNGTLERAWHYQANIKLPKFARGYVTPEMTAWDEQSVYEMAQAPRALDHRAQREAGVAQVLLGDRVPTRSSRWATGARAASCTGTSSCACASCARWPSA